MISKITNQPISYPWGSTHLIPDLVGFAETDTPIAEMWFGTHTKSTAKLADGSPLSEKTELPFMVKFLSASSPLSIQAHPNREQAVAGFKNENDLGLELNDPQRIFKDENHKPEILIAISPFRALSGFRPIEDINDDLQQIAKNDSGFDDWASVNSLSGHFDYVFNHLSPELLEKLANHSELIAYLADFYPQDRGLGIAFLLNEIFLAPGEAVYLPAGNLHAYLQGLGVEVMANSDNVVRGGLTTKHVDVEKLRELAVFQSLNPKLGPTVLQRGLDEYQTGADDFSVYRVEPASNQLVADIELSGQAILVCVSGQVTVSNSLEQRETVRKGEACYISDEARLVSFSGSGTAYLAIGN